MGRTATTIIVTAAASLAALSAASARADTLSELRARTPEQEIVYFVLPDRSPMAIRATTRAA